MRWQAHWLFDFDNAWVGIALLANSRISVGTCGCGFDHICSMKVRIRIVVGAMAAVYLVAVVFAVDYYLAERISEEIAGRAVVQLWESDDEISADGVAEEGQDPEWAEDLLIEECEAYYAAWEIKELEGPEILSEPVKRDWEMDAPAGEAIRQIARDAGINAIISDTLADTQRIRVQLKNLTALEAFQRIVREAGGIAQEVNGDYFIICLSEMGVDAPPPPEPIHPEDRVVVRSDKKFLLIEANGDAQGVLKKLARAAGASLRMSRASLDCGEVESRLSRKTAVEAIRIIIESKQLGLTEIGGAFVVLSKDEMKARYDRKVPIIGK